MANSHPGGIARFRQMRGAQPPPPNGQRLQKIEEQLHDIDKRLVRVETKLETMATQTDISNLENRVLGRLLWIVVTVTGAGIAVMARVLFFPFSPPS